MSQFTHKIPEFQSLCSPIPLIQSKFQRSVTMNHPIRIGLQLYSVQKLKKDDHNCEHERRLSEDGCSRKFLTKSELISGCLNPFTQDPKFLELSITLTDEDNESFLQQIEMFDD